MPSRRISFASFCQDVLHEPISLAWVVAYKALDGLPLTEEEIETWRALTGRERYEPRSMRELLAVKGRRAQGTKTACKYLAYKIHTEDFRRFASRTERLVVPVIAQNRDVSREIMSYFTSFYTETELTSEVAEVLRDRLELKNNFTITTQTCSYRAPRGVTAPLALLDEVGVWRVEGSDVDREVVRSLTPAMVQFPSRKLIILGSPWVKAGVLFDAWQRRTETLANRLVIHAPTATMNSLIPAEELAREAAADPLNYRREFLAEFVDDVGQFLPAELIESAVARGRTVIPYVAGRAYACFCDPSGGRSDSMCLSVGHAEGDVVVLDLLVEKRAPFNPQETVKEFCGLLGAYRCSEVVGDAYSGEWCVQEFAKHGVSYRLSEMSRSQIYLSFVPLLTGSCCELLDNQRLVGQLAGLERRTARGGRDSVDHMVGGHDDLANCCAGVLTLLRVRRDTLGLIDWFKKIFRRELPEDGVPVAHPAVSSARAAESERSYVEVRSEPCLTPPCPPCPECKAVCVTRLAFGEQFRCSQCGCQFVPNWVSAPEIVVASRANLPPSERRGAQARPSFWNILGRRTKR